MATPNKYANGRIVVNNANNKDTDIFLLNTSNFRHKYPKYTNTEHTRACCMPNGSIILVAFVNIMEANAPNSSIDAFWGLRIIILIDSFDKNKTAKNHMAPTDIRLPLNFQVTPNIVSISM